MPVFSPYGDIEKVSLVRGPDNKSRGCCMVRGGAPPPAAAAAAAARRLLQVCHTQAPDQACCRRWVLSCVPQVQFKRWADAERAMHAVNGTSPLEAGKGRSLVCHFANPRRTAAGNSAAETAIAPRKLFVGQASLQGLLARARALPLAPLASCKP